MSLATTIPINENNSQYWQPDDFGTCIIYKSEKYNIIDKGIIISENKEYGWKDAVYIK